MHLKIINVKYHFEIQKIVPFLEITLKGTKKIMLSM